MQQCNPPLYGNLLNSAGDAAGGISQWCLQIG